MFQLLPILAAFLIVLGSGLLHGWWSNRWRPSLELAVAQARLPLVPVMFGDWERLQEQTVSLKEQQIAGIAGYLKREYVNRRTQQRMAVLLVCGKPGSIGAHTPEVCFAGAGFTQVSGAAKDSLVLANGAQRADLWRARFTKAVAGVPHHLLAYWSWNAGGDWEAPENPRWHFLGKRVLWKLYVSREILSEEGDPGPCLEFLREFLPVLHGALFAGTSSQEQAK
jgi:hypothetical protein